MMQCKCNNTTSGFTAHLINAKYVKIQLDTARYPRIYQCVFHFTCHAQNKSFRSKNHQCQKNKNAGNATRHIYYWMVPLGLVLLFIMWKGNVISETIVTNPGATEFDQVCRLTNFLAKIRSPSAKPAIGILIPNHWSNLISRTNGICTYYVLVPTLKKSEKW